MMHNLPLKYIPRFLPLIGATAQAFLLPFSLFLEFCFEVNRFPHSLLVSDTCTSSSFFLCIPVPYQQHKTKGPTLEEGEGGRIVDICLIVCVYIPCAYFIHKP